MIGLMWSPDMWWRFFFFQQGGPPVTAGGVSTAGEAIGLLLLLTKAS